MKPHVLGAGLSTESGRVCLNTPQGEARAHDTLPDRLSSRATGVGYKLTRIGR